MTMSRRAILSGPSFAPHACAAPAPMPVHFAMMISRDTTPDAEEQSGDGQSSTGTVSSDGKGAPLGRHHVVAGNSLAERGERLRRRHHGDHNDAALALEHRRGEED